MKLRRATIVPFVNDGYDGGDGRSIVVCYFVDGRGRDLVVVYIMVEKSFKDLVKTTKRLRKECPWDNKETLESFAKYLREEADEVLETLENKDYFSLREELGDLMWNVLFVANLAEEKGLFSLKEMLDIVQEKMVRRHPHVYGNAASDLDSIHKEWVRIKEWEKKDNIIKKQEFYERLAKQNGVSTLPMKRTKVILFDYDGVLINSFTVACMANELIFREFNNHQSFSSDDEVYRELFETDWRVCLAKLGVNTQKDIRRAEEIFNSVTRRYKNSIALYPGVMEVLETLKEKGYRLAIVSNNNEWAINERLGTFDLLKHFDLVLDHSHGVKPEIDQIVKCLKFFDVNPDEVVMVGDMDGDILAAKRAKLKRAIAVSYGYHSKKRLGLADVIVDSPWDLSKVIE